MLFVVFGILLIYTSLFDYKKAFMGYLVFRLVLVQNITIISVPGVPLLTLEVFLSLFFVCSYYYKRRQLVEELSPFPLKVAFYFLFVSWTVSTVFAIVGVGSAMSQYLRDVCQDIILIIIMWRLVQEKEDFYKLFAGFCVVIFLSCIYGLLEGMIESNPLAAYEASFNSDEDRLIDFDYSDDFYRGYRVKSIFEHAIGAGLMWGITIIMILCFRVNNLLQNYAWVRGLILILLCLLCILLTKSRGPVLFVMIALVGFINIRSKQWIYYLIGGSAVVYIGWDFFSQYANTILSIFSSQAQDEVGGSNADMRMEQLAAAYLLMERSPIWGLGFKYLNVLDEALTDDLLGSESMWFIILPQFGLIGIIANIVLAYYTIYKIPRYCNSKALFFFALAYWITASLTSVPGLKMYYFYFVYFLMMKQTMWDNDDEQNNEVSETENLVTVMSDENCR